MSDDEGNNKNKERKKKEERTFDKARSKSPPDVDPRESTRHGLRASDKEDSDKEKKSSKSDE